MPLNMERIKYLTNKAQRGVIAPYERDELASLLGHKPQEFQDTDGLNLLIGIALAAIASTIMTELLIDEKEVICRK